MNKYAIIGMILGTFVIIAGLAWYAQPKASVDDQADHSGAGGSSVASVGALKSDSNLFDFGTISMANGKVSHEFKITNTSQQAVDISSVYTSCMCTVAQFKLNGKTYGPFGMEGMGGNTSLRATIAPGGTATLEAIYDPNAHGPAGVGSIDRYVSIQEINGGTLRLEIKAVVTP